MKNADIIGRLDKENVEKSFYHTHQCKVYNDATIHMVGKRYDTSQKYKSTKITVKYIPDISHVYIYENGNDIEIKEEEDKIENSKIKKNTTYLEKA